MDLCMTVAYMGCQPGTFDRQKPQGSRIETVRPGGVFISFYAPFENWVSKIPTIVGAACERTVGTRTISMSM
jgi:hypothetical protein